MGKFEKLYKKWVDDGSPEKPGNSDTTAEDFAYWLDQRHKKKKKDGWKKNKTGEMPVGSNVMVDITLRSGVSSSGKASLWYWGLKGISDDIVEWRVSK